MAYSYYQNNGNGWGTSAYKFSRPPSPDFIAEPRWGGMDFFRAHAVGGEEDFYESIMENMPQFIPIGVGMNEARYWHRRIYGGMVNLSQVLPADIGGAAAYEAYRYHKYHRICEPIRDPERQREALVALAIAETTRLWQFTGRGLDTYNLRAAAGAAAATAIRIAERVIVNQTQMGINGPGYGMGGMPGGMGMAGMSGGMGMGPGMGMTGGIAPGMAGGMGGMAGGMNGGLGGGMAGGIGPQGAMAGNMRGAMNGGMGTGMHGTGMSMPGMMGGGMGPGTGGGMSAEPYARDYAYGEEPSYGVRGRMRRNSSYARSSAVSAGVSPMPPAALAGSAGSASPYRSPAMGTAGMGVAGNMSPYGGGMGQYGGAMGKYGGAMGVPGAGVGAGRMGGMANGVGGFANPANAYPAGVGVGAGPYGAAGAPQVTVLPSTQQAYGVGATGAYGGTYGAGTGAYTVPSYGQALQAQPGSTIIIEHGRRRRARSVDPMRY